MSSPDQINARASELPEYAAGEVENRRRSARGPLSWFELALAILLGSAVAAFLGGFAWRWLT